MTLRSNNTHIKRSGFWTPLRLILVLLILTALVPGAYARAFPDDKRQQTGGTQIVLRARDDVHYDQETLQLAAEVIYMRVLPLDGAVYVSPEGLVVVQIPPDSQESVVIEAIRSVGVKYPICEDKCLRRFGQHKWLAAF